MAKQQRSLRQTHAISPNGRGQSIEQHESYDDSLLPDSGELARLQALDPTIIDWLKERAEKEQDGRIRFNDRKMDLLEKSTSKAFRIDILTCTYAFLIIMGGMSMSYYLLSAGQIITGSIFAGGTMIIAGNAFLNFRKKFIKEDKK